MTKETETPAQAAKSGHEADTSPDNGQMDHLVTALKRAVARKRLPATKDTYYRP